VELAKSISDEDKDEEDEESWAKAL